MSLQIYYHIAYVFIQDYLLSIAIHLISSILILFTLIKLSIDSQILLIMIHYLHQDF